MIINPGLSSETRYYTRAEVRLAEVRAKIVEESKELLLAKLRDNLHKLAPNSGLGDSVRRGMNAFPDAQWTCGDGKRVRVQEMNDSHLFFAIAKAYREEYPDSRSRKAGINALKAEALRRLVGAL